MLFSGLRCIVIYNYGNLLNEHRHALLCGGIVVDFESNTFILPGHWGTPTKWLNCVPDIQNSVHFQTQHQFSLADSCSVVHLATYCTNGLDRLCYLSQRFSGDAFPNIFNAVHSKQPWTKSRFHLHLFYKFFKMSRHSSFASKPSVRH